MRVPAGSTTGEVVLNGGWEYELDRLYAAGDNLYLVDRHFVTMEPIQDVLWRYNAATKVLERIGKYGAIDTLAAMGDSLYFSETFGEPANQNTRLLRLLQTAKTPSVVSVMAAGGDNGAGHMVAAGSLVYLHVWRNGFDWDLWASDGTPDGTRMLTPIWRRSDGSSKFNNCPCLTVANGRLYFEKKGGTHRCRTVDGALCRYGTRHRFRLRAAGPQTLIWVSNSSGSRGGQRGDDPHLGSQCCEASLYCTLAWCVLLSETHTKLRASPLHKE